MSLKDEILHIVKKDGRFVYWHKLTFKKKDFDFALRNNIVIEVDLDYQNGEITLGHPKSFYRRLPFIGRNNITYNDLQRYIKMGLKAVLDCKNDFVINILKKTLDKSDWENIILHGFIKEWGNHKYIDEEICLDSLSGNDYFASSVGNSWNWFKKENLIDKIKSIKENTPIGIGLFVPYILFLLPSSYVYEEIFKLNFIPIIFDDTPFFNPKFDYIGLTFFGFKATPLGN